MALTATLFSGHLDERRGSDRRPVSRESTLRDNTLRPHAVIVQDLSSEGCSIEFETALALGDEIGIGLPGVGRRDATVVRADGNRFGCRFTRPLPPEALSRAFAGESVVHGRFAVLPTPSDYPEPHVAKWHPAMRISIMIGGAATLWLAILTIA